MFYTDFARCRLATNHFAGGNSHFSPPAPAVHDVYPVNPSPGYVPSR